MSSFAHRNYILKNPYDRFVNLFSELVPWIEKSIKLSTNNLFKFGYRDKHIIKQRLHSFYDGRIFLSVNEGCHNMMIDINHPHFRNTQICTKLEGLTNQINMINLPDYYDQAEIDDEYNKIDNDFIKAHKKLFDLNPMIPASNTDNFFEGFIADSIDKTVNDLIKNSKQVLKKKYTHELLFIINYLSKHNLMPKDLVIHQENRGKDYDMIFNSSPKPLEIFFRKFLDQTFDNYPVEIQVYEEDLLLNEESQNIEVLFIFKNKKLRDQFDKSFTKKFDKPTQIYTRPRINGDLENSYFWESRIDWKTT